MNNTDKIEVICSHRIRYWFKDDPERELDEIDIEHIQNLLLENYVAGELCQVDKDTYEEYRGWWEIDRN